MIPEVGLPPWLLAGLALGGAFAVLVVGTFLAGQRLFPDPQHDSGDGDSEGGEERRRREIRYYLEAIGEEFVEREEVEGHRVDFYLPEREVAVTFDAHAFLALADTPVHAILCEHEMPGGALGTRLPFETPDLDPDEQSRTDAGRGPSWGDGRSETGRETSWGSDRQWGDRFGDQRGYDGQIGAPGPGTRESVEASFARLGLAPDASTEEVRAAYRERVKDAHPDHGGDPDRFQRLQDAYATAREYAD